MKKSFVIFFIVFALKFNVYAQTNKNIGVGYFGHTVTHPGVVLEMEWEKMYSDKISIPLRLDLGFYVHPRNHVGLFVDVNYGLRQYFKSGIFLEESIGVGILQSFLHSDDTYQVDDSGNVSEASTANPPDFMPSITFGIGYNLTKNTDQHNLIWLRPKLAWQVPHKTSSTYHPALQIGYTHKFSQKD